MKILVVEDDDAVRDALRRALMLRGWEVALADGGRDGLYKASSEVPDAIVLDVGMPDINGLDVCRTLRGQGDRTPILMLTARVEVPDRIAGLDAGADDYVIKPFDVDELHARLRALIRRNVDGGRRDGARVRGAGAGFRCPRRPRQRPNRRPDPDRVQAARAADAEPAPRAALGV